MARGATRQQIYGQRYRLAQKVKRDWIERGVQDVIYRDGYVLGEINGVSLMWHLQVQRASNGETAGFNVLTIGGRTYGWDKYKLGLALITELLNRGA